MNQFEAVAGRQISLNFVLSLIIALSPAVALAESAPDAYRMVVISDQEFGQVLLDGDHEAAIENITRSKRRIDRYAASNNLCVAYVEAGKPDKARAACNSAVANSRRLERRYKAIALSNRGVMRALTGETDAALTDFRAAVKLGFGLTAPKENLLRLTDSTNENALAISHSRPAQYEQTDVDDFQPIASLMAGKGRR